MKKFIYIMLFFPFMGVAQLNYEDLIFLANNKANNNITYIQKKGFTFRQDREIGDGTKQLYYEKGKLNKTMLVLRVGENSNVVISYVPEDKNNFESIQNKIKKAGYDLIKTTSGENDKCNSYESKEYFSKFCEVQFSGNPSTSYNITFYKNDIDLKN